MRYKDEEDELLEQGRSKRQVEGNYKVVAMTVIGMFLIMVYLVIFN